MNPYLFRCVNRQGRIRKGVLIYRRERSSVVGTRDLSVVRVVRRSAFQLANDAKDVGSVNRIVV